MTVGNLVNSTAGEVKWTSFELDGKWKSVYLNKKCLLLKTVGVNATYQIYMFNRATGKYDKGENITPLVNNLINNTNLTQVSIALVKWVLSQNGDRLRIGKFLFKKDASGKFVKMTVYSSFVLSVCDRNLSYAIGTDGKVWKYVETRSGFVPAFTPNRTLP